MAYEILYPKRYNTKKHGIHYLAVNLQTGEEKRFRATRFDVKTCADILYEVEPFEKRFIIGSRTVSLGDWAVEFTL